MSAISEIAEILNRPLPNILMSDRKIQLKLSNNRSRVEKEIAGALKNAIDSHGPIMLSNRHSAAKRVYCALKALAKRCD